MSKKQLAPNFIFEASWEVCNKVGGIYTVLSTRAKTLQKKMADRLVFIGPDVWKGEGNPLFKEDKTLLAPWRRHAARAEHLGLRVGRWQVPGEPVAVLVDFQPFFAQRNEIYAWAWERYGVDSLHAYGDYDEASMFSYAAGRVAESYYRFFGLTSADNVVYQAHEWMACLGALYVQQACPAVATVFTTHATSIGRSIAGNDKPLYDRLHEYNGDQMAAELNMQSKHSVEKQTAHHVDCFTTVSDITAAECAQLLEKPVDAVLMNGFENGFIPKTGRPFDTARKAARRKLLDVANALTGASLRDDTLLVAVSGRYEYKNKGLDMFVDAMNRLRHDSRLARGVAAFIMVPAWAGDARADLREKLARGSRDGAPCADPRVTHNLFRPEEDRILRQMDWLDMRNGADDRVRVVFVPRYLDGHDGIFDLHYYDLLIGMDLCVFPSYYEPWGYTPTESVAFHVPCVTTDLAGFGLWANKVRGGGSELADGVKTVHRCDGNFVAAAEDIRDAVLEFAGMDSSSVAQTRKNAAALAEKAMWKHFICHYYEAYDIALRKAKSRRANY